MFQIFAVKRLVVKYFVVIVKVDKRLIEMLSKIVKGRHIITHISIQKA